MGQWNPCLSCFWVCFWPTCKRFLNKVNNEMCIFVWSSGNGSEWEQWKWSSDGADEIKVVHQGEVSGVSSHRIAPVGSGGFLEWSDRSYWMKESLEGRQVSQSWHRVRRVKYCQSWEWNQNSSQRVLKIRGGTRRHKQLYPGSCWETLKETTTSKCMVIENSWRHREHWTQVDWGTTEANHSCTRGLATGSSYTLADEADRFQVLLIMHQIHPPVEQQLPGFLRWISAGNEGNHR